MSDELENYLMSGTRHASISAEALEQMGKQAANRLLNEKIQMNETISKLAAEHKDINGEQVKRICEYANSAVYLAKHDQSKTAGAGSSYPQFDLADPSRIIQEMSDGARPTVTTAVDLEYSKLPEKAKTASMMKTAGALTDKSRDEVLDLIFGSNPEKTVELNYSRETVVKDIMDTKEDLVSMKENLGSQAENALMNLKEAQATYFADVKEHLLNGGAFAEVVVAAQAAEEDKQKVAEALRPIIERLFVEKIASPDRLSDSLNDNLEKVAHRIVNDKHPFVSNFKAMISLSDEVEKVANAMWEIDAQLGRVQGFIKEKFLANHTR